MAVNEIDLRTAVRDIGDLIASERDPMRRFRLCEAILSETSDIADRMFAAALYEMCLERSQFDVADDVGMNVKTLRRWLRWYSDLTGKPVGRYRAQIEAIRPESPLGVPSYDYRPAPARGRRATR